MIDYGEDKMTYGAPEFPVGWQTQLLSLAYIGGFVCHFFLPEFTAQYLSPNNAHVPDCWWSIFPGVNALIVPDGFALCLAFIFAFLLFRPLELRHPKSFALLWLTAVWVGGLAWWSCTFNQPELCGQSYFFPLLAAAGALGQEHGHDHFTLRSKKIPQSLLWWGAPGAVIIGFLCTGAWPYALSSLLAIGIANALFPRFIKFFGETA